MREKEINDFCAETSALFEVAKEEIDSLTKDLKKSHCFNLLSCEKKECPIYGESFSVPCWLSAGFFEEGTGICPFATKKEECQGCKVYKLFKGNLERFGSLFGFFHMIGVSSGFLDLQNISKVATECENLLILVLEDKFFIFTSSHIEVLIKVIDFIEKSLVLVQKDLSDKSIESDAEKLLDEIKDLKDRDNDFFQNKTLEIRQSIIEKFVLEKRVTDQNQAISESVEEKEFIVEDSIPRELIDAFVQETDEALEEMEQDLLTWSASGEQDPEIVANLFRRMHTLKGNSGFYGYHDLQKLAHQIENIFDAAKSGVELDDASVSESLLRIKDVISETVAAISKGGDGKIDNLEEHITTLGKFLPTGWIKGDKKPDNSKKDIAAKESISDNPQESTADVAPTFTLTPELIAYFVNETEDLLQQMEQSLLKWKESPTDLDVVASLFRRMHSLKGNCGFYGYSHLEKLSHQMENVLDAAKSGVKLDIQKMAETMLRLKDVIGEAVEDISQGGVGEIKDLNIYLELLTKILPKGWADEADLNSPTRLGDILVTEGVISDLDVDKVIAEQNKPFGEKLVDMGLASAEQVEKALGKQKKKIVVRGNDVKVTQKNDSKDLVKRENIRVDLEKLDILINLIGEMAIAENMITSNPDILALNLENFNKAAQQMNKIVRELQEMAMTIRMIPVSGLFRRMIRLVHDLSNKCNKKVELKLVGEETEVDKTVVEIITDPMVHIIRNSLDHGIETPEERLKAGKPVVGSLILSASHEEGQVRINIIDDGRGLNRERIVSEAIAKGLIDGDGSQLTDAQVFNLIFIPGFSTAKQVTDVSGRGVGMDVVKRNLEKIKGRVSVKSKLGEGTTISLRIPLTLAIIDGMIIRIGELKYIIPVLSIRESFVPLEESIIASQNGLELVRLRENFLPVIRFDAIYENSNQPKKSLTSGVLVVLENQGMNVCLFVDELIGQQQVVIKGLSDYINTVRGISGCTILGDGAVSLIIDVGSLVDAVDQKQLKRA